MKDPNIVIKVTISSGEDVMYLPEISTMEGREAVQALKDMGLKVNQVREAHDEIPQGMVISCSVPDGSIVERGDTVTLVISTGPKEIFVTVPLFVGTSIEQVRSQIESLGLELTDDNIKYFNSEEYAEGLVMWQSISTGDEVESGSAIVLHVSLGPKGSANPEPSEDIVIPSEGVDVPPTVRTVEVDLSSYNEIVTVRIMVGGTQLYYGMVDCSITKTLSQPATGTGMQTVDIYIDDKLFDSYELQF